MSDKIKDETIKNDAIVDEMLDSEEYTDDDIITLTGDNGEDIDFYHEATIEYKDNWYVLVHPVEKQEDVNDDEILIMKLVQTDSGEDALEGITDDKTLQAVYELYEELVEEYNEDAED